MYLRLAAVALLLAVSGCDCRGAALVDKPEPDCKPETCDGYDEDCDGVVDNGLPELSCGVGACARTVPSCAGGATQACEPGAPAAETCNGLDDDCDGTIDEALPERTCGVGACARTLAGCADGVETTCTPGEPGAETCNGLDDDCDGATDEELAALSCGTGACARTVPACLEGVAQACTPGAPGTEACNGVDDDCDGVTDEDLAPLTCGAGACARTVVACVDGVTATCTPGTPAAETCNGLDDDCDGDLDEGLAPLSCGQGLCARTVLACIAGQPQTCTPLPSAPETCNGLDDDCDGSTDEDLAPLTCGQGACLRTVAACNAGQPQTCTPGTPSAESCDGVDNDCDGQTDEGLAPLTCGTGACARTVAACSGGQPQACTPGQPTIETCNGLDDDCDGQLDEELAPLTCGTGACLRTVAACANGQPQTCTPGGPSSDVCDGVDNDCDGTVDDDGICQVPVVMCPGAITTPVGSTVPLAGSATDADGTIVATEWAVLAAPASSTAQPASPTSASTTFTPDRAGSYTLRFCARDNAGSTSCCSVGLSTTVCSSPPAPPVSTACGTSWDGRPIVQFSPVPAGLTYQLTRAGETLVLASAAAGANHLRPAARVAAGGPVPGVSTALEIRACRVSDPTCCSAASPVQVNVVEACTTPITPTSANVVLSEYVINGDGACPSPDCLTQDTCEAGEAVEITNLSNCPVSLDGFHFAHRSDTGASASYRWMNFGAADVIPPRGVYVALRNRQYSTACAATLGAESTGLYGLRISPLAMLGPNLCSGWFKNASGGLSELRLAPGTIATGDEPTFVPSAAIARVAPYTAAPECQSIGFNAVDSCGSIVGGSVPTSTLSPNQLGRLWHPCDAVLNPVPACVRD
jgi:hypothetical protein